MRALLTFDDNLLVGLGVGMGIEIEIEDKIKFNNCNGYIQNVQQDVMDVFNNNNY